MGELEGTTATNPNAALRAAVGALDDETLVRFLDDVLEDRRSGPLIKAPRDRLVRELRLVQGLDWAVQRHLNVVAGKAYRGRHPKHWLWREHKRFVLDRVGEGMRVLDVGCGASAYLLWMAEAGAEVTAIDVDERKVDLARSIMHHDRLRFEVRDATRWRPHEAFDLAICSHVIEHLAEPVPMLAALRNCAPRLIVCVPRVDSRWQKVMYRDLGLPWMDDSDHEREYTPALLAEQVEAAGWTIVETEVGMDLKVLAEAGPARRGEA